MEFYTPEFRKITPELELIDVIDSAFLANRQVSIGHV